MTEKERNCLLRIAGELVELCRTSEKTKASKVGDTLEETYINPLGPMPNREDLEQRAANARREMLGEQYLNAERTPEELEQQTKLAEKLRQEIVGDFINDII